MRGKTLKIIRTLFAYALSIMLVLTGLLLIAGCINIYSAGDHPFSPAAVAAEFSLISGPVCVTLFMVLLALVLNFFFPDEDKKVKNKLQPEVTLKKLMLKADLEAAPGELVAMIEKEQKARKLHRTISALILGLCALVFFNYATTPDNFHQTDITGSMVQAMYRLIPCLALPFGYCVFTSYFNSRSFRREAALLQDVIKAGAVKNSIAEDMTSSVDWLTVGRISLLLLGVTITAYGYFAGGTLDVLTKAINICTECVGLG